LSEPSSRDDPGSPAVTSEYACAILISKIVYELSYSIEGTMYPFCNGDVRHEKSAANARGGWFRIFVEQISDLFCLFWE
jgi:hypothetical protein